MKETRFIEVGPDEVNKIIDAGGQKEDAIYEYFNISVS